MKVEGLWIGLFACLAQAALSGCGAAGDDGSPNTCSGSYWVDATDTEADLEAIADCGEITGDLGFEWTLLADLDGLSNLTAVGGDLYIGDNTSLTNVDGLSNLRAVGGYLHIFFNGALSNVNGLSSLTTVGESLSITDNALLCQNSVDALVAACTVGAWTSVYGNNDGC